MPTECAVCNATSDAVHQLIEVSGWDTEGQFFVEISDLELSDSGDATARLFHRVHSGSLVFVRLLHGNDEEDHHKSHPTPTEAEAIGAPDFAGRCRVRLTPCQPRAARRRGDQKAPTGI
jgi:hypothetical protein